MKIFLIVNRNTKEVVSTTFDTGVYEEVRKHYSEQPWEILEIDPTKKKGPSSTVTVEILMQIMERMSELDNEDSVGMLFTNVLNTYAEIIRKP